MLHVVSKYTPFKFNQEFWTFLDNVLNDEIAVYPNFFNITGTIF